MITRRRLLHLAAGAAALGAAMLVPRIASATARVVAAEVNFSSLAGSTDDIKLASFCTTYRTAAYKPTLVLDELRAYNFSNQQLVYSGFALVGVGRLLLPGHEAALGGYLLARAEALWLA